MVGMLEGSRKEEAAGKMRSRPESTMEQIKKAAEEIVRQAQQIGQSISEKTHEAQRRYQKQRQQSMRKEEMLQDTLAQLKEEHSKLLEERQRLALETETEQEEIKRMKEEQQAIEERQRHALGKKHALNTALVQITFEIGQLRRVLKQEEEREEKEGERVRKEIEYYAKKFGLAISTAEGGSVLFLFSIGGHEHYFQIGADETYSIVKASVDEKVYKRALKELNAGHDLFLFVKRMKETFEEDQRKKSSERESRS